MKYITTIEERDGVLRMELIEPGTEGPTTVALLACVLFPESGDALHELLRLALEAVSLRKVE